MQTSYSHTDCQAAQANGVKHELVKECVCPTYPRPTPHCTKLTANVILQNNSNVKKATIKLNYYFPKIGNSGC